MSPVTMIRQPTICMDDVSSLKDRIMQLKLSERQRDTVDLLFRPLERNLESNTSPKGTIHESSKVYQSQITRTTGNFRNGLRLVRLTRAASKVPFQKSSENFFNFTLL